MSSSSSSSSGSSSSSSSSVEQEVKEPVLKDNLSSSKIIIEDSLKNLIERKNKIHIDVWTPPHNGFSKGDGLLEKLKSTTNEKEAEKLIKHLETILTKAEEKQKEREAHEKILDEKYKTFLEIIRDPAFPTKGEHPGLDKTVNSLESKFDEFKFDENNHVISGKVSTMYLKNINVGTLIKTWESIKNKKKPSANLNVKKTTEAVKIALSKWETEIQNADQEVKDKAQKIQNLLAEPTEENMPVIYNMMEELQKIFKKDTPMVPAATKSNIGQCSRCNEQKKRLFGVSQTCHDCYNEEELEDRVKKIYAKEKQYYPKITRNAKINYEAKIKNKYATYLEKFNKSGGTKYYEELIDFLKKAEDLMVDIEIDSEELSDINDSFVEEDEEEGGDGDDEEEKEQEDYDDDDDSLYKNGLPKNYDSSEEFKKPSKKRDRDNDMEEVVEIMTYANEEERKRLLKTLKQEPKSFKSVLKEVKEKHIEKYKIQLFHEKVSLPDTLIANNLFYSEKEATEKAKEYCGTSDIQFKIIKLDK
jgi:gas vesicle protein